MQYLGYFLVLGSYFFIMHTSSTLSDYLDVPTLGFILGSTFGVLLIKHGSEGVKFWWMKNGVKKYQIAKSGGVTCILSGLASNMLSFVAILANLSDPSAIGPALAIALLGSFYGLLLYLILFFPFSGDVDQVLKKVAGPAMISILAIGIVVGALMVFFPVPVKSF